MGLSRRPPAGRLLAAALVAAGLLAGCAVVDPPQAQPTWVPKPEGPAPGELPNERVPLGPDGGSAPGSPSSPIQPGSPDDPDVVAAGLTLPWGLAVLPDGSALVGERTTGRVLRVQPRRAPAMQLMQITGLDTSGDGGLLDLTLSPDYVADNLIFAYITTPTDNRVIRFEIGGRPTPVLTGIPRGKADNGGRLAFGPDGMLYIGTGDAGQPGLAADPRSLAGKVLRVTLFGQPAPGNPDPRSPVFTRGHRNVAGLCVTATGTVEEAESWPSADPISRLVAGGDYGWPPARRGPRAGATGADLLLTPATATPGGCAIIQRTMFVTALAGARLWAVALSAGGQPGPPQPYLTGIYGRLRTVVAAPDGALWLTTSNRDGAGHPTAQDDRVIRLLPPAGSASSPA